MKPHLQGRVSRIAFVGNHTPRQCGLATFTADLSGAIRQQDGVSEAFVVAMNDDGRRHKYPAHVRLQVADSDLGAYRCAADAMNDSHIDVVSLQHEYGIFGGEAGSHVLSLLRRLRTPIVTTLHTILANPSHPQRMVMDQICALSDRVVVMSESGAALLQQVHGVRQRKVDVIPHGVPSLPAAVASRAVLGLEGKRVLLTFGLLSPDKGIEHVIDALPAIAARYPSVVYIVLGTTHPHVRARHGEAYRHMLEARSRALGVEQHVMFCDRFASDAEVGTYLAAADIYITPYLNPEQITSGTLAYAVGSGKAVISSPYRYARELLADGRGVLVPFRDASRIAYEAVGLLDDDDRRHHMERCAAELGHAMDWSTVARRYLHCFERTISQHEHPSDVRRSLVQHTKHSQPLPDLNLGHLRGMTDDTGLLQHAAWTVPRYEDGYCLDDNARALMLMTMVEAAGVASPPLVRSLGKRYLAFVRHAFDVEEGRFRNFLSYSRQWAPEPGSEDSHGRAIWALGTLMGRSNDPGSNNLAAQLFHAALPATLGFTSPRAWAFTLLGICEAIHHRDHDAVRTTGETLALRLLSLHRQASRTDWSWFEDRLTYSNARLPQALLSAGAWLGRKDLGATGLESLQWLASVQRTEDGLFAPIGTAGFYIRGGPKAEFDQQPVDACGMVSACLEAHRITTDTRWISRARPAFDWFLGHNQLDQCLYDPDTGGCRDGLHPERPNQNQGAESTLSFLMALLDMRLVEHASVASGVSRVVARQQVSTGSSA